RLVAHANKKTVVHRARGEPGERDRPTLMTEARHVGRLMWNARHDGRVVFTQSHLDDFDFRRMMGRLIGDIHDAKDGGAVENPRVHMAEKISAAGGGLGDTYGDLEGKVGAANLDEDGG